MAISTVLLDLDGVIRHFDSAHIDSVAQRHGIAADELIVAALSGDLLTSVTTGRITRAQWIDAVGEAVGNRLAAAEWLADRGTVDPAMVELVHDLRGQGTAVAILTNGTDTIPTELAALGISELVDRVFNTSDIGLAKPDPAVFAHVCASLGVAPATVFFTDDAASNVAGGREAGLDAVRFVDAAGLRADLRKRSVPGA